MMQDLLYRYKILLLVSQCTTLFVMVNCSLVLFPLMPGVVSESTRNGVDGENIIQEVRSDDKLFSVIDGQDDTNVLSRMLKMAVRQGRSERGGEAYASVR